MTAVVSFGFAVYYNQKPKEKPLASKRLIAFRPFSRQRISGMVDKLRGAVYASFHWHTIHLKS